ncbi:unnamed protein product [Closterium sp. NIES-64]|nr:unnamed protein product [Closterium sp. NIES-64]
MTRARLFISAARGFLARRGEHTSISSAASGADSFLCHISRALSSCSWIRSVEVDPSRLAIGPDHLSRSLVRNASACSLVSSAPHYGGSICRDARPPRSYRFSSTSAAGAAADAIGLDDPSATPVAGSHDAFRNEAIRNVAIIAHVDHGKTTLMDRLIRASSSAAATTTSASGGGGGGGGSGSSELPCDRVMDSIALERERGITIASKYTSVTFRGTTLNLVDTPGHADFGGEVRSEGGAAGDGDGGWGAAIGGCGVGAHTTPTSHPLFPPLPPTQVQRVMGMVDGALLLVDVERVMGMVDGALLLVDVAEGPLAQTKFVLGKALQRGLKPIVVLNKCDRPSVTTQMVHQVESAIFDLFASFDATEEQLDFPVLYASARHGWASSSWPPPQLTAEGAAAASEAAAAKGESGVVPILEAILDRVPPPVVDPTAPFQMLVSLIDRDPFLGRLLIGRIASGSVRVGDRVRALMRDSEGEAVSLEESKVVKLVKRRGVKSEDMSEAAAGDIVAVAGMTHAHVSQTLADLSVSKPLPVAAIDPPTIAMTFSVNDSPLAGRHGTQMTGPKIGARLKAEVATNVSLGLEAGPSADAFKVLARGEMQLGVLIESMRREGFELSISPPSVLYREEKGKKLEPIEELMVEVDEEFAGAVIDAISLRKGELLDMITESSSSSDSSSSVADSAASATSSPSPSTSSPSSASSASSSLSRTRLLFTCPSRGLLGVRGVLNTATRGTAVLHRSFLRYEPWRGQLERGRKGVIVSMATGTITAHALSSLEARGTLFVSPGDETYDGHIIGENARDDDMEVNPVRTKELTNIRAASKDENIRLTPPRQMSLEEAMGYVQTGELVEVTPAAIRLRKKELSSSKRKTSRRNQKE